MPKYSQSKRKFELTTPLGKDVLLFQGIKGQEGLSRLFEYEVLAFAENTSDIPFDKLLGQKATVKMKMGKDETPCYINGICSAVSEGGRDHEFTSYKLLLVPEFWILTRKTQSRIFQQISVPDILRQVFAGLTVDYRIMGTFQTRDFCVQYRESDFAFASRLMEEEGIFYYYKHADGNHTMVVANTPSGHDDVPGLVQMPYEELKGGIRDEERVLTWEKQQNLRSGKTTLWDHCFELPHRNLEAQEPILTSVSAGTVTHKFKLGANSNLELYDWPGAYAQRFDGVDPGGADRASDINKIFPDSTRTAGIRMGQETTPGMLITAKTNARHLRSGHKFKLQRHFNADGEYVIVESSIDTEQFWEFRSGAAETEYRAWFTCIPSSLPFRPPRTTPKPVVPGSQSAVVVGPSGEEIFVDKYGRVKVQFHWDRQGKRDASSSCWIRVGQLSAGRKWGSHFWPRVGQEVIVDFLEGDPDQPIIVGVVYNADQMPPYTLPDNRTRSGLKTNSSLGGDGFNELRFEDKKSSEQIFIHAQKDMDVRVKNDMKERILHDRHVIVGSESDKTGDYLELTHRDRHITVKRHHQEKIEGNMKLLVGGPEGGNMDLSVQQKLTEKVGAGYDLKVSGDHKIDVSGGLSIKSGGDTQIKTGPKYAVDAMQEVHIKGGMKVVIEAGMQLTIKAAGGFITIDPSGVSISGLMVKINSGGSAGAGGGSSPASPADAQSAAPTAPQEADNDTTGRKSS